METYQDLHILVPEKNKDIFFKELQDEIQSSKWSIRQDLISNYKKNTFTSEKRILCVESEKYDINNHLIQGLLWLWDYKGFFEVFNIIPVGKMQLEYDEYNYILNKFNTLFITKIAKKHDAKVTISKAEKLLIESIGKEAFGALKSFSNNANKSSGYSHPYDFERWCDFVFIIYRNDIEVSISELINWFEENGWDDEMANKLGLDFEYSIDLLKKYEQNS